MDELTILLGAVRDTVRTLTALEAALVGFSDRVGLQGTLSAFPADGKAVDPDTLDPCPTVEELLEMLQRAAAKNQARVREIIAEEADGKKVRDMTDRERQLVRISLELSGLKPA